MEALATIVFERTPAGALAIKANSEDVARRLRTLLLALDGRSPVSQYVPFLTAFAPLSEKFAELERLGYVRRKGNAANDLPGMLERRPGNAVDLAAPGTASLHEADLLAWAGTSNWQPAVQTQTAANALELELQLFARQMSGSTPAFEAVQPSTGAASAQQPAAPPARKPVLQDILGEMNRFLSQSAGAEALPVSVVLEQIKSLAQLRAEAPAYFELVQRYGESANSHIERVAGLLNQAGD